MKKPINIIREWIYRFSFILILVLSGFVSFLFSQLCGRQSIISNSMALATSGIGIAAFLFVVQSILITIPENNRFVKVLRQQSSYLLYLHGFCRRAELGFMFVFIPLLFIDNISSEIIIYIVLCTYIFNLAFSIWSMWILGAILISCERNK